MSWWMVVVLVLCGITLGALGAIVYFMYVWYKDNPLG